MLKELEAIVHPLVAEHREEFLARNADAFLAVVDVPLLYVDLVFCLVALSVSQGV